jgi:hypothetical protein
MGEKTEGGRIIGYVTTYRHFAKLHSAAGILLVKTAIGFQISKGKKKEGSQNRPSYIRPKKMRMTSGRTGIRPIS